ncbi:hypothetical protein HAX54_014438 [Datura stramonium]|uniref:Peroxin-3 n=1 Tax=Datura stramonium TaxID=4076 RepID=A0ABS8RIN5_DATST|nr:hypothetical protein [Datura stramonium]
MWEFWRRHKKKVYVTFGVLGSGYLLYKRYDGHRRRLSDLDRELADERRNRNSQIPDQGTFLKIQTIADSTTLPHVMRYLSSRIEEELDLTHLMQRLMRKERPAKFSNCCGEAGLWDRLKILSMDMCIWLLYIVIYSC